MPPNPFSTSQVAPGRLAWLPVDERTAAELANEFLGFSSGAAVIVGPHGSGKSTLLAAMQPHLGKIKLRLDSQGRELCRDAQGQVLWLQLRKSTGAIQQVRRSRPFWNSGDVLILDGFEQLSPIRRVHVWLSCRRSAVKLLATAHRRQLGLQTLIETSVDPVMATSIVRAALVVRESQETCGDMQTQRLAERKRLEGLLQEHHGNMREVFMSLYDDYQTEQRKQKTT